MRLRFDGRTYGGRTVDLRGVSVDVRDVREALGLDPEDPLAAVTPDPPPARRALAAAARTRGHDHPNDDEIRRLREAIAEVDGTVAAAGDASGALARARERAADAAADVDRLRERAATLRGRLRERRDRAGREASGATDTHDGVAAEGAAAVDGDDPEAAYASATRALADAETELVAARQALARSSERARTVRDARERRLRLEDALANRRRETRADLARAVSDPFAEALAVVDPTGSHGRVDPDRDRDRPAVADASGTRTGVADGVDPIELAGDPVAAHAAAVRVAAREDPVVVAVSRFETPAAAAKRLRAPVAFVSPP